MDQRESLHSNSPGLCPGYPDDGGHQLSVDAKDHHQLRGARIRHKELVPGRRDGHPSHGPVYAWYPVLKDLKQHGMRNGLIAVFLYNRAIKTPLLPMMVYYFGMPFVIVLLMWMIPASLVEGSMVEILDRNAI